MDRRRGFLFAVAGFLGLLSIILSVAAEFKKSQVKDLRLDGKFCSLPTSPAFGLGVAAAILLVVSQIIGYTMVGKAVGLRGAEGEKGNKEENVRAIALSFLSSVFFAFAILLLGVVSSMNQLQPYGEGWRDGNCYIVKNGVYSATAALSLFSVSLTLTAYHILSKKTNESSTEKPLPQFKIDF